MDGIYVVMSSASELVAVIGGERYVARFLFTPAVLRAGDRVWLRVEKQLDGTQEDVAWGTVRRGSAADVTARITRLYPRDARDSNGGKRGKDRALSVIVKPRTGVSFLMTIDEFGAVTPGDEATRARFGDADGGATIMEDATEKVMHELDGNVFGSSSEEATLRDDNLNIGREQRWSA